ncbi:MAG: methyltransferase domain-containing protein [Desulfuromonadaceae bacterium]|nr:methyltransferase domain-containing protein [Desulfuromonadaceae bacterium]
MKKIELLVLLLFFVPLFCGFTEIPIKAQSPFEDVTVDVPYITMPQKDIEKILEMAQVGPDDLLYDLGSGDGRIVIAAAEKRGARGVGVEIDGELVRESRRKAKRANVQDRVEFIESDLFKVDFSKATVVTLYLMPDLNLRLRPTLLSMPPGTRVISHSWDMGEWQPDEAVFTPSLTVRMFPDKKFRRSKIHLWIIPADIRGNWHWREVDGKTLGSLRINQRFQEAEGTLTDGAGESPATVEIKGDWVRITPKDGQGGKSLPILEGRVDGGVINGTATYKDGTQAKSFPWKAFRQPETMTSVEKQGRKKSPM